jgi:hypothetical protein
MPGFWDNNVRRLELMIWKLFFKEHLRKLGKTPAGELSPYLLRSPSGSGIIEGAAPLQGGGVEETTMTHSPYSLSISSIIHYPTHSPHPLPLFFFFISHLRRGLFVNRDRTIIQG